jgi:hypothetical protein
MTELLNFSEFYQRKLIVINPNDLSAFQTGEAFKDRFGDCTHWLIALEGNEIDNKTIQWRVVIYPSRECGHFNHKHAYFKSPFFPLFDEAVEFSKEMEAIAKQDQLYISIIK